MSGSIQSLYASLEALRLGAIKELAEEETTPTLDALQEIAIIQTALTAVREEIAAHEVKVGGGGETPLE